MSALRTFHFVVDVQGDPQLPPPLRDATGDARPPDLKATANVQRGQILLQVDLIVAGGRAYLKAFTGGWQPASPEALAQYFDAPALFDRSDGLFAALPQTTQAATGKQTRVESHAVYQLTGHLPAERVHRLLPLAAAVGDYTTTYWIETPGDILWRARISGPLFDASHVASMSFAFSHLDEPVTISSPPVG